MIEENHPKLFISYCWSSQEHGEWVLKLANELRESGVDVIIDKWDLKEGQDAIDFMEKMVKDPHIEKVILIFDRLYSEKADDRIGGVGTETQIITPEIYLSTDQNKFVGVLSERNNEAKPYLPTYYKSRIYIDLSNEDLYATNFDQLLRWVYDQPLYEKPAIGKTPAFLSDFPSTSLGTTTKYRRALEAIRNNRPYWKGALAEYFDTFVENLERFRMKPEVGEIDDKVIQSIEEFLPFRNEALEIFLAIAQYCNDIEAQQRLHRFFEGLIPYLNLRIIKPSYQEWDFDNYRFIIHELFLYAIASLLKYESFDTVSYLLRQPYYYENLFNNDNTVMFSITYERMKSLSHRKNRLKLNQISLRADLLKNRAEGTGFDFNKIMQADFVLFIRDSFDAFRNQENKIGTGQRWWPDTLVFARRYGAFEIFARGISAEYFNRLKCVFDINEKIDFEPLLTAFRDGVLFLPNFGWYGLNLVALLGYDKLATLP